jgi:hypothetical protein
MRDWKRTALSVVSIGGCHKSIIAVPPSIGKNRCNVQFVEIEGQLPDSYAFPDDPPMEECWHRQGELSPGVLL